MEVTQKSQNDDKKLWEAVILSFRIWKSVKQLFNLYVVSNQQIFFTHFQHFFFGRIFIWHTIISAQNRDELSHAWLFELPRVNVKNVHDCNAECGIVLMCVWLFYGFEANTGFMKVSEWRICSCFVHGRALTLGGLCHGKILIRRVLLLLSVSIQIHHFYGEQSFIKVLNILFFLLFPIHSVGRL